jgi:hypothetical protein
MKAILEFLKLNWWKIGIFILSWILLVSAQLILREGKLDNRLSIVFIFTIGISLIFLLLKNKILRFTLFIISIFSALFIQFMFGFMCFDQCPSNSELIFTLVVLATFLYTGVLIWSMFKNKIVSVVLLLISFVWHAILLLTSTAGFG